MGLALTLGGVVTVVLQTPAGAIVDRVRAKRMVLVAGVVVLACGALLLAYTAKPWAVYTAQTLIGGAGPFLAPTLAAITMGFFGVVAVLVVADRTRGTGRFNLVQGALATAVGLGAALSTTFGGKLIQLFSYRVSFLALGAVAFASFLLLLLGVPETRREDENNATEGAGA